MYTIALVDDHSLLRKGLIQLVQSLGYEVVLDADDGKEFIAQLNPSQLPDLVLMDLNMPEMDGCTTTQWLQKHYPAVNVIALSMYDNEASIIRMLRCGARGYILKDCQPADLKNAIEDVMSNGYHYSDLVTGKLLHAVNGDDKSAEPKADLKQREIDFLKYACTEFTYKEIADKMYVSPRTIDGYRDSLFEKLQVKTRVGLAIYAINNGLVEINRQ